MAFSLLGLRIKLIFITIAVSLLNLAIVTVPATANDPWRLRTGYLTEVTEDHVEQTGFINPANHYALNKFPAF